MIINNNNQYEKNISVGYFYITTDECACAFVYNAPTSRKLGFRLLFHNHIPIFVVHWSTIRRLAVNRTGQTQILYDTRGTYHSHTHSYGYI